MLAVLGLFTIESPEWTVEEAAESLGASVSPTYRYFRALTKVGLLSPVSREGYMLGPAIIDVQSDAARRQRRDADSSGYTNRKIPPAAH